MDIIGHTKITEYLLYQKEHGTLSHAYLFVGPQSVGKRTVADWFMSLFGNCEKIIIEQDETDIPDDVKTSISIKAIRSALAGLSRSTFDGVHRFVIIDNAELLTQEAGNALLKKLEDPPRNTIFIFITPSVLHLLPTIVSRCQLLRFAQVSSRDLREGLQARGIGATDDSISFAAGLPGKALRQSTEKSSKDLGGASCELNAFFELSMADRLLQVSQSLKSLDDLEQYVHRAFQKKVSGDQYARFLQLYTCLQKGYRQRHHVHIERIRDAVALV